MNFLTWKRVCNHSRLPFRRDGCGHVGAVDDTSVQLNGDNLQATTANNTAEWMWMNTQIIGSSVKTVGVDEDHHLALPSHCHCGIAQPWQTVPAIFMTRATVTHHQTIIPASNSHALGISCAEQLTCPWNFLRSAAALPCHGVLQRGSSLQGRCKFNGSYFSKKNQRLLHWIVHGSRCSLSFPFLEGQSRSTNSFFFLF